MADSQETGKLIVVEGPDGVGKSTIADEITRQIRSWPAPVLHLTFPGKAPGTVGQVVYDIHHDPPRYGIRSITPSSLQALHIAAHLDTIERVILPALHSGQHVLLDRFWWSTWVYGVVGGMNKRVLRRLIDVELALWGNVRPTVVVLLRRDAPIDRDDNTDCWRALRREYDALAEREIGRYPVASIDNVGPLDLTVSHVMSDIAPRLTSYDAQAAAETESASTRTPRHMTTASGGASPHISPARPTEVYDTYWRFAAERQRIFFRRLEGHPPPWTDDPILARYKFTNAYRASDRVSQYLIRHVIYRDDLPTEVTEVFFRIMLFKIFNKIETWDLLEHALGPLTYSDYHFDRYDAILSAARSAGESIYSAAYIMPPGERVFGQTLKHRNHLRLLERLMIDEVPARLAEARSMQTGFDILRAYPTIGDFLAYQFITDINYSEITHFSEMEFVMPGPGALDGIQKCFLDPGGLNEPELIRFVTDRQEAEFERLGLPFRSLWGRPLQLIDCQNLFCEVAKYARAAHPTVMSRSGRTHIKQRFAPNEHPLAYMYPPAWGLNDAVKATSSGHDVSSPRSDT